MITLTFNMLLREAETPLKDVRLLRHKDLRSAKGRPIYELWRDDRTKFDRYQSIHSLDKRASLAVKYWASFVGTPDDRTLFAGLYSVNYLWLLDHDMPRPQCEGVENAGCLDQYRLRKVRKFATLDGRLFIDWGTGKRAWIQRPERQDKPIVELRPASSHPPRAEFYTQ